ISDGGANSQIGSPILLKGNLTVRPTYGTLTNFDINFIGNITQDATPRKLIKTNFGNVTLTGTNGFTGGVDINPGVGTPNVIGAFSTGVVTLASAGALDPANVVSFGPAAGYYGVLRLNGQSPTLAGIQTTGGAGTTIIENGTNTLSTLTVNNTANFT